VIEQAPAKQIQQANEELGCFVETNPQAIESKIASSVHLRRKTGLLRRKSASQ
jgi:hypothetical protein